MDVDFQEITGKCVPEFLRKWLSLEIGIIQTLPLKAKEKIEQSGMLENEISLT